MGEEGAGWRDGARPSSGLAVTIIKNIAWLNKNQRDRRYAGGREGGVATPGQTLATAVVRPKAIDHLPAR